MKKLLTLSAFALLLTASGCIVAPAPGYYPGPYVATPAVYGGGYYYHHGYGYYR